MKPIKRQSRERGTQIVELALALPLLLFLALAIIEGAGMVRTHQIINNAAREGARLSSIDDYGSSPSSIQAAVVTYAANNGVPLTAANVTIDQLSVTTSTGLTIPTSRVTVTYTYTFSYLPSLPFFTVAPSVTLQGVAEFRNLFGT